MNTIFSGGSVVWCFIVCLSLVTNSVALSQDVGTESTESLVAMFHLDGDFENTIEASVIGQPGPKSQFVSGLENQALRVGMDNEPALQIPSTDLALSPDHSFSVQFWVRTIAQSDSRFVLVSSRPYPDNSLESQKRSGWTFYSSHGTWAWSIGSEGKRRLTYERDNGERMPLDDGRWHQLSMTYEHERSIVRLYYDGVNMVTYNVQDSTGFDFRNLDPLVVGSKVKTQGANEAVLPAIVQGAERLQELVDRFQETEIQDKLQNDDLLYLVVEPKRLFQRKLQELENAEGEKSDQTNALIKRLRSVDLDEIEALARGLTDNRYTIHQAIDFMKVAPLLKLYRLEDGKIEIDQSNARIYSERERLRPAEWDIDQLAIWNRCLTSTEVSQSYARFFQPVVATWPENKSTLTVASWNIHHGGIHETVQEDGWDSREVIAEIIRREEVDIVLMQETYSNGDYVAAELGYFFATTVDWDYLNQGANISVLSRYPIDSIDVPGSSPFMNVAARITIADSQPIYAMSNWYGMQDFPKVAKHHETKFGNTDDIPVFFGGDFNAVPHTDGGSSPASVHLLDAGFKDAYRERHPDYKESPGPTHRSGRRIDQLFYKGAGYQNLSTEVLSTWPSIFPSDHYLIKSIFQLPPR